MAAPALLLILSGCAQPPAPKPQEKELVTEEVLENEVDLSGDVVEVAPTEVDLEGLGLILPAVEGESEPEEDDGR